MTDERTLLLAVADAAGVLIRNSADIWHGPVPFDFHILTSAHETLSAYRGRPNGDEPKTVLVRAAVIMSPCGDHWTIVGGSGWEDEHTECVASEYARGKEIRCAVIVAHVEPPTTPVVTGSVET